MRHIFYICIRSSCDEFLTSPFSLLNAMFRKQNAGPSRPATSHVFYPPQSSVTIAGPHDIPLRCVHQNVSIYVLRSPRPTFPRTGLFFTLLSIIALIMSLHANATASVRRQRVKILPMSFLMFLVATMVRASPQRTLSPLIPPIHSPSST
jgi:hypothetical protein